MSKSPSLRRIQADVRELALDPSDRYHAAPLENDMFEWHFTIRGADGTDFEGGIYHGRILLPPDYPFKPPHIMFLTPSGRFETNTKVCLSFSAYHPELWQPAWGIRLILEALISFLPTPADGAIGALDWSSAERKRLAAKSVNFQCPHCGKINGLIPEKKEKQTGDGKPTRFQKEIEELHRLQSLDQQQEKPEEKTDSNEEDNGEEKRVEAPSPTEEHEHDRPTVSPPVQEEETRQEVAQESPNRDRRNNETADETTPLTNAAEQEHRQALDAAGRALTGTPPRTNERLLWLVDPILQLSVVVFACICFLLIRKIERLLDEINALD